MPVRFEKVASNDAGLRRVQDNIEAAFASLPAIINGVLLEDVDVSMTSGTQIAHGLGRAHRGWIVVKRTEATVVYEQTGVLPDRYLYLIAGSDCRVNLWVF